MLGEKERFYILGQQILGNRACMLQILGTSVKKLGKLLAVLEIQRNSNWGTGVGERKV